MIRPFKAGDFEAYEKMSREFYQSNATEHQAPDIHFRRTFDETVSGSPLARGWMLFDEAQPETPAGYLLASISWSTEFGGRICWLEELYLKAEFRGLRLGREALETAMEELKTKDEVRAFRLEVAPANAGVSELYQRLGFAKVTYEGWWLAV